MERGEGLQPLKPGAATADVADGLAHGGAIYLNGQ
jgi:hypothetical protein